MKITKEIEDETIKRINARNSRTLLLNLSEDTGITNKEAIHKLVPTAVSVRIPNSFSRNKIMRTAFVEFESQTLAEKSYISLQTITLPIGKLEVDHAGRDKPKVDIDINPLRLYVSGIPVEASTEELKKLFPKANISRNESSKFRKRTDFKTFAIVEFSSEEDAKAAFWSSNDAEILGKKMLVLFAKNDSGKSKLSLTDKNYSVKMKIKRLKKSSNSDVNLPKSAPSKKSKNKPKKDLKATIIKSIEKGLMRDNDMETE